MENHQPSRGRYAGGCRCDGCRDAHRLYNLAWRRRHAKPRVPVVPREIQRAQRRQWLDELKLAIGCADCGYNLHPAALHFDHLDGATKVNRIAQMTFGAEERLLAEIAKCEVVCANCHAIRTARRRTKLEVRTNRVRGGWHNRGRNIRMSCVRGHLYTDEVWVNGRRRCRTCNRLKAREWRAKIRVWLDQIKQQSGCVDCQFAEHPEALHFDHRPGEVKIGNISQMAFQVSKSSISAEIEKCDVVCANCHTLRTAERGYTGGYHMQKRAKV